MTFLLKHLNIWRQLFPSTFPIYFGFCFFWVKLFALSSDALFLQSNCDHFVKLIAFFVPFMVAFFVTIDWVEKLKVKFIQQFETPLPCLRLTKRITETKQISQFFVHQKHRKGRKEWNKILQFQLQFNLLLNIVDWNLKRLTYWFQYIQSTMYYNEPLNLKSFHVKRKSWNFFWNKIPSKFASQIEPSLTVINRLEYEKRVEKVFPSSVKFITNKPTISSTLIGKLKSRKLKFQLFHQSTEKTKISFQINLQIYRLVDCNHCNFLNDLAKLFTSVCLQCSLQPQLILQYHSHEMIHQFVVHL